MPGEVVGPVHHVQPHEGGGEEDAAQHVYPLGAGLVAQRPLGQHRADGQLVGDQLGKEEVAAGRALQPPDVRVLLVGPVLLLFLTLLLQTHSIRIQEQHFRTEF